MGEGRLGLVFFYGKQTECQEFCVDAVERPFTVKYCRLLASVLFPWQPQGCRCLAEWFYRKLKNIAILSGFLFTVQRDPSLTVGQPAFTGNKAGYLC